MLYCEREHTSLNETSIGSINPSSVLTFETTIGLATANNTALFKVYTVTSTGREKGSIVLKITRP